LRQSRSVAKVQPAQKEIEAEINPKPLIGEDEKC
jgi:hypothetical protein